MQLLSHNGDRLVFHLEKEEVELFQHLIEFGLTEQRGPVCFSHAPGKLPRGAADDFVAAVQKSQLAGREFLRRVFQPDGDHLQASAAEAKGYGLTLTRPEMERLLQALNDIKLAHWEALGYPEGGAHSEDEVPPEGLPSVLIMDLINQVQMLLLSAISAVD